MLFACAVSSFNGSWIRGALVSVFYLNLNNWTTQIGRRLCGVLSWHKCEGFKATRFWILDCGFRIEEWRMRLVAFRLWNLEFIICYFSHSPFCASFRLSSSKFPASSRLRRTGPSLLKPRLALCYHKFPDASKSLYMFTVSEKMRTQDTWFLLLISAI